jgi:hypothetical protein
LVCFVFRHIIKYQTILDFNNQVYEVKYLYFLSCLKLYVKHLKQFDNRPLTSYIIIIWGFEVHHGKRVNFVSWTLNFKAYLKIFLVNIFKAQFEFAHEVFSSEYKQR